VLDQPLREALRTGSAHEGDERARDARERRDVELLDVVRGERRHRLRDAPMRHRDESRLRHGRDRRDAGDELEGDTGVGERERLLPAAAEHERVAALEADDEAPAAVLDQRAVHLRL
jgi:hypothetical protein